MSLQFEREEDDVVFQNNDVCILRPDANRGIVVFHHYPREAAAAIAREGLVLGNGSRKQHPYHFFRAPAWFHGDQRSPPSSAEISQNYPFPLPEDTFCIRIDPFKTAAFMSEMRVVYPGTSAVLQSRKMLPEFWRLIADNARRTGERYHVLSGIKSCARGDVWVDTPPERNAEVLVALRTIPPAWRVIPR